MTISKSYQPVSSKDLYSTNNNQSYIEKQTTHFTGGVYHSFSSNLAKMFSIEEAVLIHHFIFWITHNHKMGVNFIDGRTWSYQTHAQIQSYLDYFTVDQIRLLLKKLVDKKILIKANHNKNKFDQTVWYAFSDENQFLCLVKMDDAEVKIRDGDLFNPDGDSTICIYKDKDPKEEDIKEDKKEKLTKKRVSESEISLCRSSWKFKNITEKDISDWKEKFPLVDSMKKIEDLEIWAKQNPTRTKNYRFNRRWLEEKLQCSQEQNLSKQNSQNKNNQFFGVKNERSSEFGNPEIKEQYIKFNGPVSTGIDFGDPEQCKAIESRGFKSNIFNFRKTQGSLVSVNP